MVRISSETLHDRVLSVDEVSTLPISLARILEVTSDRSSTALDLAAEIAKDPALTMKVLRTVNSAFFGFRRRIQTVSDAVILLGFTEVERLALAISVINLFGGERERARSLSQLWRHSLAASMAASILVEEYKHEIEETGSAHVAALLHDIGKAILGQAVPEAVHEIERLLEAGECRPFEAEMEVLDGVSHCEVGAWVAEGWSLPVGLVESLMLHHRPDEAPKGHVLVHITHLADALCHELDIPSVRVPGKSPTASPESYALLAMDDSIVKQIDNRLQKQRGVIGAVAAHAV